MTALRKPPYGMGSSGYRTPRSIAYGLWKTPAAPIEDRDIDDLGVEDLADLVADEVVHRLHVELGREALLDAGDDGQLGGSLVGLGQQTAGLGKQACVLEGDAHARGEGAEKPGVGIVVGVSLGALQGDDPDDLIAGEDRHAQPRLVLDAADEDRPVRLCLLAVSQPERRARPDDRRREATSERPRRSPVEAFTAVDR